jgi:hypothetical protein
MKKEMKRKTELRQKFLTSIGIKAKEEKFSEDVINQRILAPLCILDVAYGLWQEKIVPYEFKQEAKQAKNEIAKKFNEIYSTKGVFYKGFNQDDIYEMSEMSDKMRELIDKDVMLLYYALQKKCMDIDTEAREIFCNILVVETLLLIPQASLKLDWNCQYRALDRIVKCLGSMAKTFRNQQLGSRLDKFLFTENDKDFMTLIRTINRKMYRAV